MKRFFCIVLFFIFTTSNAHAIKLSILILNRTSVPVIEVHASRAGAPNWGFGRLDLFEWVLPGDNKRLILEYLGYCNYDIRATMFGGGKIEHRNVDLCEAETWTLVD